MSFAGVCLLHPHLAEAPMVVDLWLMLLFAALAVIGGFSFGLLYRRMQVKEERLSARALNAEEELRAMLTMTDDSVFVLDSMGAIRAVNPAAEELFCRSEDDFVGEEISRLLQHPLHLAELTRHGPANFDATALRSGSETLQVEVLVSQVQHVHGTSYLALIHEKQAHETATVARVEAGPRIAKHCHDLNNQLTGILGHLSLVLMSAEIAPPIHERLISAKKSSLRAQETTRKIHAVARGESEDAPVHDAPAPGNIVPCPTRPPIEPPCQPRQRAPPRAGPR